MYEFRYAKEHAIARTFQAFQLVEKCLLLGLMVAVSLKAQQSSPLRQRGPVSYSRLPVNLCRSEVTVYTRRPDLSTPAVHPTREKYFGQG